MAFSAETCSTCETMVYLYPISMFSTRGDKLSSIFIKQQVKLQMCVYFLIANYKKRDSEMNGGKHFPNFIYSNFPEKCN
jgi:hypothetical protein